MKYIIALCIQLISLAFAADTPPIDDFMTPESMSEALEKADMEFKTFILDKPYLDSLRIHYQTNLYQIRTENFVKYYLVGTCDLHELLAMAERINTKPLRRNKLSNDQTYLEYNQDFFKRFYSLFYHFLI